MRYGDGRYFAARIAGFNDSFWQRFGRRVRAREDELFDFRSAGFGDNGSVGYVSSKNYSFVASFFGR